MEKEPKPNLSFGWTLEDYIEHLLRLGKKRDAPEFQTLFQLFGEKRVVDLVNKIRRRWKENASKTNL